jgi:hypothetical protein
MAESGVQGLPATLADHCRPSSRRRWSGTKRGRRRRKLEIAYLRWLDFAPAAGGCRPRLRAAREGGPPSPADYKTLQDYLFAYVARSGRLRLAIHIHVANGGGGHYDQRGSNPLL